MSIYDFDQGIQEIFNQYLSGFNKINWKNWLELSNSEEYENLALKLSGLESVGNLYDRIKHNKTNSRDFSINLENYIESYGAKDPLLMCHTSGTTDSNINGLKWFHMTKSIIQQLWAPGMQAIFESSGLKSNCSAVIFIPSRMNFDGIQSCKEKKYISLYSSEFSQRLMLSIIKPKSYLIYPYRNSCDFKIISKILSMDDIEVISAPSATILKWADLSRFNKLLKEKSSKNINAKMIQEELSKKLSNSTLVFSTSSLSEYQWNLVRKFMKWKKGEEKFTNLYVGTEIGPFAANIHNGTPEKARLNILKVFPLTLPSIELKGKRYIISRIRNKIGNLFVSRMNNGKPLINIDTGDVISIINEDGLPQIQGKINRNRFKLKYKLAISNQIKKANNFQIYAGDYFELDDLVVKEPRNLLNCLNEKCGNKIDSILLLNPNIEDKRLTLILPRIKNFHCNNINNYKEILIKCPNNEDIKEAIRNEQIKLLTIEEQPVQFLKHHSEMIEKVRRGLIPKGILKRWPMYILIPET